VDDARGGDQLIRRVATNIKLRTGACDFARQRPHVQPGEHSNDFRIVQIDRDPAELGQLGDLPEDDGGDASRLGPQQPRLTWTQRADDGAQKNARAHVQHSTAFRLRGFRR
jgi:hypothetical protein